MFNVEQFNLHFNKSLTRLARVEAVTKEVIKNLSREVLVALHETGDIGYINKMNAALSPMNRRTFVLYAQEFTGFVYEEGKKEFTKKNKQQYEGAKERALEALEDVHFNMWTWAERNIVMEAKPFDITKVTQFIKQSIKKGAVDGITQADILRAVLGGGIEIDTLIDVLQTMDGVDLKVNEE